MTDKPHASPLVTAIELARHLGEPEWIVVDCRFNLARPDMGEEAWRHAHIPGAFYAHLDRDLASARTPTSGRHPLPDPQALARLFSRWGVMPGARVVAYDDVGGAIAARLWWLLRWMGHRNAALLDGGLQAWEAAGLPLSADAPPPRDVAFEGTAGHMPVVSAEELEGRLGDRQWLLIDARARARYLGAEEPIDPVAGHVPGAINIPFQKSLGPQGRFRSQADLQQLFEGVRGIAPDRIAVMCGSGVTACHDLFAMELAGLQGARLYPGSWSEWIRSPQRPVARDDTA